MSDYFLCVDVVTAGDRYVALVQCHAADGDVSYCGEAAFDRLKDALEGLDALIPSVADAVWNDGHRIAGLSPLRS